MNNRPKSKNQRVDNFRAQCADIVFQVIEQGQSLSTALSHVHKNINDKDRALMQEICFGVMRVLPELEFYVQKLMDKVLTGKNRIFHFVLLTGIYQIVYTRVPPHAAVAEAVNAVVALKKPQLKGLINAVLRSFLRQQQELKEQFEQSGNTTLHPNWFIKRIKQAYPDECQSIVDANNQKPPMWLRVNKNHYTTQQYQTLLKDVGIESILDKELPCALRLVSPVAVNQLPQFFEGVVSVQDLSAQYAAPYLEIESLKPKNGESILDLCAAPGGKTTHILECAPNAKVTAVDIDAQRVKRINENLQRLKLSANVIVGDGLTPELWCKGEQFDRILLDAPCSATGVIRRHPDIKWLRRDSDISELATLQYQILTRIWPYLKENGILVYATCSILPDENRNQIERFLKEHADAKLLDEVKQLLPNVNGGDGFFYAKLKKQELKNRC